MKWLWVLMAAFALTASAADVSGTWKGSAETQNGTIERTFVFKADGNKLTGETTSNMFGKSTIEDGKVDEDDVSFSVTVNVQGTEGKVNYKGKVEGDTIKFKIEVQAIGQTLEMTAKRVP
jgi:osmotically-inducible protein OsmY